MPALFERTNLAPEINPPPADVDQILSTNGSDWLWAVTALFAFCFVCFYFLTFVARSGEKIFHYLFTVTLLVGLIAYFAQASDLAWSTVTQVNQLQNGDTRQIFYAKYVYWVVSFPVMAIVLGLVSGVSWATIFYNVCLSWTWVLSYLFSAYTESNYKWGFYAFGTIAWAALAFSTLLEGHRGAARLSVARDHALVAGWTNLLWLNYPLAYGLSDGGNRITVNAGFIWFGILDVLMVPLAGACVLVLSRGWDYGRMNIAFTQYGRVPAQNGVFPEKAAAAPAGGPVTDVPAQA